ncbi:hypothetical protein IFM89_003250 [Coptis chinensis]|uniref:Uncharacterized protein n=1 Tax=Coptis chinensis TaxID=261450 RepID=A0A835I9Z8_9MAGN|nr:hypothetical protein IFM89_003250 [Coptis chinensis]
MKGRAVVVGGSIGGISCAHALIKAGWDVVVIEKTCTPPTGSPTGAGLALDPQSQKCIVSWLPQPDLLYDSTLPLTIDLDGIVEILFCLHISLLTPDSQANYIQFEKEADPQSGVDSNFSPSLNCPSSSSSSFSTILSWYQLSDPSEKQTTLTCLAIFFTIRGWESLVWNGCHLADEALELPCIVLDLMAII